MPSTPLVFTRPALAHQVAAADKLTPLRVGALFMEPGTGKTRTVMEIAARRRGKWDRVVILCPVSAMQNIAHEIRKHVQDADPYVFSPYTRSDRLPLDREWYVVGLESLSSSDRVTLAAHALITDRTFLVVDESDLIRGVASRRTMRSTMLARPARYRMILSGTPAPEGLVDLYAQMRFLDPRILGYHSFYGFAARHLVYSTARPGLIVRTLHDEEITARVSPYVFQARKQDCLDLPQKRYSARRTAMSEEQEWAYAQAKRELLPDLDNDLPIPAWRIFQLFTALRSIACGFWNRRDPQTGLVQHLTFPNTRRRAVLLEAQAIPAGDKGIIWASFHHLIRGAATGLRRLFGLDTVAEFHGGLSVAAREAQLARWRLPDGPRFLVATPASGGRSLTLTESAHAIFANNEFKFILRDQAEDRMHRISQTRPTTYTDIWVECGIEKRIERALVDKTNALTAFKRQLAAADPDARRALIEAL